MSKQGYHFIYRGDGTDRCPGCGRQHFYIGTITAECAFCGTAIPRVESRQAGGGLFVCRSY